MSDFPENTPFSEAPVPLEDWFDKRFRKADGARYRKRRRDQIVRQLNLPVIKVGWAQLILPTQGDAVLAKRSPLFQDKPRRGRPRANQAAD